MSFVNRLSAHFRGRVYFRAVYAAESFELVTDAKAMLGRGETLTKAVWQTDDTMTGFLYAPVCESSSCSVTIAAQYEGRARIRADITTSTGRTISAWHYIRVKAAPSFPDQAWVSGPRRLEAVAGL